MTTPEPWSATDKDSFAFESTAKRWPIILTSVVNDLWQAVGAEGDGQKADEGKQLIQAVSSLKYDVQHDRALTPLEEDGGPSVSRYNEELARLDTTWFGAPWLFAECYLYRRLRTLFGRSTHWRDYDPFLRQKLETFRSSGAGVHALVKLLDTALRESDSHTAFDQLATACLWGNATDLSLLTNLSHSDIAALQSGSADKAHRVLVNDLERAWKHISGLKKGRIDFVLDNSGFELFTDLVLAEYLVSTPHCDKIVFHPKLIPWFVSDVTPNDFKSLFTSLADLSFFANDTASPLPEDCERLEATVKRWRGHLAAGRWELSVPIDTPLGTAPSTPALQRASFWTEYDAFFSPPNDLLEELAQSGLVIFKGDLNYRKLTGDLRWPAETPFRDAIGSLAGKLSILALRTCKADVIVGLPDGKAAELDAQDKRWRVSGSYAVIQFCARV